MLTDFDLFKGLTPQELDQINSIVAFDTYQRGSVIFNQGDPVENLYIIESGQVEISVKNAFQEKKIVAVLKNHDTLGEMGLFDRNSGRSATARALQTTRLVVIPGLSFENLLVKNPSISGKLLGTVSKRLKESNQRFSMVQAGEKQKEGRIVTLASACNGYGKTAFATSLSHLLSKEAQKSTLFLDLDLYYGEGSYILGMSSGKSIIDLSEAIIINPGLPRDEICKFLGRQGENLYCLTPPASFLEAEGYDSRHFIALLKTLRHHFDYIVVDTDSHLSDLFLNALDISDLLLFLTDLRTSMSTKNSARYFQTLFRLNFPPERMCILATKVGEDFNPERLKAGNKVDFQYKVQGGVPFLKDSNTDFGRSFYQIAPESTYFAVLRNFVRVILKEESLPEKSGSSLLNRLFGKDERVANLWEGKLEVAELSGTPLLPSLDEKNLNSIFHFLRQKLIEGFHETVRAELFGIIHICPDSPQAFLLLGETYLAERNFSEAITVFQKVLKLSPGNPLATGFLGYLTTGDADLQKAIDKHQAQIEKQPNYADLHKDLGRLFFLQGDFGKAQTAFRQALKINPHFLEARINLAIILGEIKQFDKAIHELDSIKPSSLRVYYLTGKFFYAMGRFPESQLHFEKAAVIKEDYLDLQSRLESLRGYFQHIHVILEKYQELLNNHPTFPDLHLCLAELLLKAGKYKEAQAEVNKAIHLKPEYPEARQCLDEIKRVLSV